MAVACRAGVRCVGRIRGSRPRGASPSIAMVRVASNSSRVACHRTRARRAGRLAWPAATVLGHDGSSRVRSPRFPSELAQLPHQPSVLTPLSAAPTDRLGNILLVITPTDRFGNVLLVITLVVGLATPAAAEQNTTLEKGSMTTSTPTETTMPRTRAQTTQRPLRPPASGMSTARDLHRQRSFVSAARCWRDRARLTRQLA